MILLARSPKSGAEFCRIQKQNGGGEVQKNRSFLRAQTFAAVKTCLRSSSF